MKIRGFEVKSNLLRFILIACCAVALTVALCVLLLSAPTASALTPRAPIRILGNSDFTPANGVVSGEGTFSDPYIIEGWDISAASTHGIWIEHTTAYFVVRNCCVHGSAPNYHGVYLYKVYNGQVENVESSGNLWGIALVDSGIEGYGCTILDCYLHENWWSGIYLYETSYTMVDSNMITNSSIGVYLHYSDGNTLTGNTANNSDRDGFWVYESDDNEFRNCTSDNSGQNGFYIYSSDDCIMSDCGASYNAWNGFNVTESSYCTYIGNTANNNTRGIFLYSSSNNNTLTSNTANNNTQYGIFLYSSSNNTLTSNTAEYNNYRGIVLYCSSDNALNGNTANHNWIGIWLYSSSDNALNGNTANNNDYGIMLFFSNDNRVASCQCLGNVVYDVYDAGAGNIWIYIDYDTKNW